MTDEDQPNPPAAGEAVPRDPQPTPARNAWTAPSGYATAAPAPVVTSAPGAGTSPSTPATPSTPGGAQNWSAPPERRGGGTAIAALILGIIAILLAVVPFLSFGAFLPAVAGVAFGIVALAVHTPRFAMALVGLILSAVAVFAAAGMSFLTVQIAESFAAEVESSGGAEDFLDDALGELGSVTFSGNGDETFPAVPVDGAGWYGLLRVTATGSDDVVVTSFDADGNEVETLVDEFAPYSGTLLYNTLSDVEVETIEIRTDGGWTVEMLSSASVDDLSFDSSYQGYGDDVLYYEGDDATGLLSTGPDSDSWLWSTGSMEALDCDIPGDSRCEFPLVPGGVFVQVYSIGEWTLEVAPGSSGTTTTAAIR